MLQNRNQAGTWQQEQVNSLGTSRRSTVQHDERARTMGDTRWGRNREGHATRCTDGGSLEATAAVAGLLIYASPRAFSWRSGRWTRSGLHGTQLDQPNIVVNPEMVLDLACTGGPATTAWQAGCLFLQEMWTKQTEAGSFQNPSHPPTMFFLSFIFCHAINLPFQWNLLNLAPSRPTLNLNLQSIHMCSVIYAILMWQ